MFIFICIHFFVFSSSLLSVSFIIVGSCNSSSFPLLCFCPPSHLFLHFICSCLSSLSSCLSLLCCPPPSLFLPSLYLFMSSLFFSCFSSYVFPLPSFLPASLHFSLLSLLCFSISSSISFVLTLSHSFSALRFHFIHVLTLPPFLPSASSLHSCSYPPSLSSCPPPFCFSLHFIHVLAPHSPSIPSSRLQSTRSPSRTATR